MKGFKSAPPKASDDQERERRMAEIISGATASPPTLPATPTPTRLLMPWRDPKVRDDAVKQVNLRLPEPLAAKLDMVSKLSDRQKQDLVTEALAPFLDGQLRDLGYRDDDL